MVKKEIEVLTDTLKKTEAILGNRYTGIRTFLKCVFYNIETDPCAWQYTLDGWYSTFKHKRVFIRFFGRLFPIVYTDHTTYIVLNKYERREYRRVFKQWCEWIRREEKIVMSERQVELVRELFNEKY